MSFGIVTSEERFQVINSFNEVIFNASKTYESGCCFCGVARNYVIRLTDRHNHEELTLIRKMSCKFLVFTCRPDAVQLIKFPGKIIGSARHKITSSAAPFVIENAESEEILRIGGPLECSFGCCPEESKFNILSADRRNVKGTINRIWNPDLKAYTINIFFDHYDLDVDRKTLIIGAAFMLDTKYFRSKIC